MRLPTSAGQWLQRASYPEKKWSFVAQFKLMFGMIFSLLRPKPKTASYLALDEFSDRAHVILSADSPQWRRSHEPQGSELSAWQATL